MAKYCTNCGSLLNEYTGICPNCGTNNNVSVKQNFSLPTNNQKSANKIKSLLILGIGVVLIALIVGVILYNIFKIPAYSSYVINYGKTRTEYLYDSEGTLIETTERIYDKKERTEEISFYGKNGELVYKGLIEFDKKGFVLCQYAYDQAGDKMNKTIEYEYEFSNKSQPDCIITKYIESGTSIKEKFKYDKNGSVIEGKTYEDGKFINRYVYSYDKKGKLKSVKIYDEDDNLTCYYEYEVDRKNRIISSQYYDLSGEKGSYLEIEYED